MIVRTMFGGICRERGANPAGCQSRNLPEQVHEQLEQRHTAQAQFESFCNFSISSFNILSTLTFNGVAELNTFVNFRGIETTNASSRSYVALS